MDKLAFARKYFAYQRQDDVTWQRSLGRNLTRTVVEIPARGGSTRLKNKNVLDVCGQPLIAYTIRFALALGNVDRVVVNTDCPEIAAVAREHGAETPFLRPAELAQVTTPLHWSTFFLKRFLMDEGYPLKKIVTLLPTSPFRNRRVVENLVSRLDTHYSVVSAFACDTRLTTMFVANGEGPPKPLGDLAKALPESFFVKKIGMFSGLNVLTGTGKRCFHHLVSCPVELIDIDTGQDLAAMERIVRLGMYDFGCAVC